MIGQLIAQRYELEGMLGSGGRGVVYRGRDRVLGRQVAVKLLRAELDDQRSENRFRHEARTAARLEHPTIVPIYDFGRSEHGAYLVMPRVHGESLRHFIEAGELTPEDVVEVGLQAADALVYSHGQGVVHRDIKPGNLMAERLDDGWRVRLLDFGIALDAGAERLTDEANVLGTPLYLSPEQLLEEPLDARSDIYSLGVVLYECLTGRPPITGRLHRLIQKILSEEPAAPSRLGVELAPELEDLVLRCLAKKPEDRPPDARAVRDQLRAWRTASGRNPAADRAPDSLGRRPTAIVGRAEELRTASQSLEAARAGRCQLLLVGGDGGIGKSTLLRELETLASAAGVRCIHGRFVERHENSFPYHGFYEAIRDFFAGGVGWTERQPDLGAVAVDLLRLFPMLEDVAQIADAAGGSAEDVAAEAGEAMPRSRIFETLARALARLAGAHPLVILLEDLQQADVSVDALQYCFRRLAATPTLIAAAFETPLPAAHPLESLLLWSARESNVRRLQLGPLSRQEVARWLEQHLGQAEIDAESLDVLFETSGGHPLFLAQLVRSWLDAGVLARREHGRWQLEAPRRSGAELPHSMRSMLEQRLAGLEDGERSLIEALSIIGPHARRRELEALADQPAASRGMILRELVSRGFLIQRGHTVSFANTLMREIAYRSLEQQRRRQLHRELARVLETQNAGHLDRVSFRLAHHWSEGQEIERAAGHLLSSARQALAGHSPEDAAQLADRILALCEAGQPAACELRAEALALLAQAHFEAGRQTQALAVARQASEERLAGAQVLLVGAEAAWATGRLDQAAAMVEDGLADSGGGPHRRQLLELRARIEDLVRPEQSARTTTGILDAAAGQAARSFERLGEALLVQGEYLAAREAFETAHAQRLASGETTEDAVEHLVHLAELALKLGDYREALAYCDQGLEIARDPLQKAHHEALAGRICCSAGDFEEASRRVASGFDHLADTPRRDRGRRAEIEALLQRTRGNVWVGLGDADKALRHYRESLALLESAGAGGWERSIALFNLGEALMHLGRDDEALDELERAFVEKSAIGDRWGLAYVHHARARILRRRGELEAAAREASIGAGIADRIGDPKIEAMLQIELGRIVYRDGRRSEAEQRYFRALRLAEQASARPEVRAARRALEELRGAAPQDGPKDDPGAAVS